MISKRINARLKTREDCEKRLASEKSYSLCSLRVANVVCKAFDSYFTLFEPFTFFSCSTVELQTVFAIRRGDECSKPFSPSFVLISKRSSQFFLSQFDLSLQRFHFWCFWWHCSFRTKKSTASAHLSHPLLCVFQKLYFSTRIFFLYFYPVVFVASKMYEKNITQAKMGVWGII